MPLADLWQAFRPERVLYTDDDLIVVDKPPFAPVQAPERGDDVYGRLRALLSAGEKAPVYLGVHHRLERDVSGVCVFTRRKEANRTIAEQFERRRTERTYLAAVVGLPGPKSRGTQPDSGVLRHRLAPGEGGQRVLLPSARGGEPSALRYRVLERRGERTLLEIRPEPGSPIDLPAQLAAEGTPVLGDARHDGPPAHRLGLHLGALTLRHPRNDRTVTFQSPLPAFFSDWLEGRAPLGHAALVEQRLREAAERRYNAFHQPDTNTFRLAHAEGDGLPGVTVDVYGDHLVVSLYDDESLAARETILDGAFHLGPAGIYLKLRPKHASRIVDGRSEQFSPKDPVRGLPAPEPLVVHELGLPYETRLGEGLSTGIFLDQRENRRRVREMARGLSVLNLFAYTCPFTVAAAAGGAKKTVSVDVSRGALEWARRNLDRIGADPEAHLLVEADALKWLEKGAERHGLFDLVILDPPSFATTKQTRFSAESDYKKLAAQCLRILGPGGRLLACTNHKGIGHQKFRRSLHDAARDAGREVAQMKDLPDPDDFPPAPGGEAHLKSVLVTLA